jgi:hypothetical protein
MRRHSLLLAICALPIAHVLTGCEPTVRNCPVISKDPSTNLYNLEYSLLVPADCPVPLSSPGTEVKYAGAMIIDYGTRDFDYASVEIKNSKGKRQAHEVIGFIGDLGSPGVAFVQAEYKAATGTQTFSDYDVGIFRAYNLDRTKNASGQTKITYQQSSLQTHLTGPVIPAASTTQTWVAPTSGGVPAYQYHWYRNGSPVGSGSTYTASTGSVPFNLQVDVTDQTWSTRSAVLRVDVNGVRVTLGGPSVVYASEGGGTWTASGEGGSQPYSYAWYMGDVSGGDVYLGSGPTYAGYPGEGTRELRVMLTDAVGKTHIQTISVTGFGNGGSCNPIPPQITCVS